MVTNVIAKALKNAAQLGLASLLPISLALLAQQWQQNTRDEHKYRRDGRYFTEVAPESDLNGNGAILLFGQ